MSIDLFSEDLEKYGNDEKYAALCDFCATRTNEGWRLDYAETWDDRALEKVASFANTFGGILIVGVRKEKKDIEPIPVGVKSTVEYKTRIASAIAANISPVPSYYIYEWCQPTAIDVRFCLIQVRNTNTLHLVTKKATRPIHIRNEDETREADASDVRRLLERTRLVHDVTATMHAAAEEMYGLLRVRNDLERLGDGREKFSESPSFLKIVSIPAETRDSRLEKFQEEKLKRLVRSRYLRVTETEHKDVSDVSERRDRTFFQWSWFHKNENWDAHWLVKSDGRVGFATQITSKLSSSVAQWSLVDFCDFLSLFLKLNGDWWQDLGYFGEGAVFVNLAIDGSRIFQNSSGAYGRLLNPGGGSRDFGWISADSVRCTTLFRSSARANELIIPAVMGQAQIATVASLSNSLLRDLGHLVDLDRLQKSLLSF